MTTGPTPPPLPPPVPVPVQPLAYTTAQSGRRPGIITSLGVVAIIVAAMSGLVSFLTFLYGGMFYSFMLPMMAASSRTTATSSGTVITATNGTITTTPGGANPVTPPPAQDKLSMADASTAVNTLRSLLDLDGARVRELDKLIRAHGREILGDPSDDDNAAQTNPRITDAWLRESISSRHPASRLGAASFTNKQGRVEIFPDRAIFQSADGSQTIRSSAARRTESVTNGGNADSTSPGNTPATQPGTTLTSAELRGIMRAVRRVSPQPLTPAQAKAVEQQLSLPNQAFVTPGTANPVVRVFPSNNSLYIQFDQGMIDVGAQGQIISATTGISATGAPGLPTNLGIVRGPLLLVILEAAASLALAVYLLIVGIMVCRSSFSSPKLLRIYAWIKIFLACLAGFAVGWLVRRILEVAATSSATTSGGATAPVSAAPALMWAFTAFILGIGFPIAVLICLRTRTVREFFNSVSA